MWRRELEDQYKYHTLYLELKLIIIRLEREEMMQKIMQFMKYEKIAKQLQTELDSWKAHAEELEEQNSKFAEQEERFELERQQVCIDHSEMYLTCTVISMSSEVHVSDRVYKQYPIESLIVVRCNSVNKNWKKKRRRLKSLWENLKSIRDL
jgi:hypothetical protein